MTGSTKTVRAGDMMRDAKSVSCSILYGQDNGSPISSETAHVLYVAYAPVGVPVEAVEAQLSKIVDNVRLSSPRALVEQKRLLLA